MMQDLGFSVEVMPPRVKKTADARSNQQTIKAMFHYMLTAKQFVLLQPAFFSVTYRGERAGDKYTAAQATRRMAAHITRYGFPVVPHLTAVGKTPDAPLLAADDYWQDGMTDILALRGDPPQDGVSQLVYKDAHDLTRALVARRSACGHTYNRILVAANPEDSLPENTAYLHNKIKAAQSGAVTAAAVTQVCLDEAQFENFMARNSAAGISSQHIIAGILPIHSEPARIRHFTAACGVCFPSDVEAELLDGAADDYFSRAAAFMEKQISSRHGHGIRRFHIYSANHPNSAVILAEILGHAATKQIKQYSRAAQHLTTDRLAC